MEVLDSSSRKKFLDELQKYYGITLDIGDNLLLRSGDGKIRLVPKEVYEASKLFRGVQLMGLYIAKWRNYPTLTIEGCMYVRDLDLGVVEELNREKAMMWMKGGPVEVQNKGPLVIGRYRGFYLGSALVDRTGKAYPQIPKWRRIPEYSEST